MTKIEIEWSGPYIFEDIKKRSSISDYGIYQIYGTHAIFGENTLLYIGKAQEQTFAARISQHKEWLFEELGELKYFIGQLGGIKLATEKEWTQEINDAEKLLIYFSSPPYNSQNINDYGDVSETIILNFGKRNRLPMEVSTLYYESDFGKEKWKIFGEK
ncbi:MAG: hypothetical protein HQ565_01875 [Bacteroidetes bacterium]|nr:hypothetical protein [Bacteroidota bacterium]